MPCAYLKRERLEFQSDKQKAIQFLEKVINSKNEGQTVLEY
jgi:hypothetical protein